MKCASRLASTLQCFRIEILKCQELSPKRSIYLYSCPNQIRIASRQFSSNDEADKLLCRPEVQNYLSFLNEEYKRYENTCLTELPIMKVLEKIKLCESEIKKLKTISTENDKELEKLIKFEQEEISNKIRNLNLELVAFANPKDPDDEKGAIISVASGVGGMEAKLFSEELFDMYIRYAKFKNWYVEYVEKTVSKAEASISGSHVFKWLKYEAGVHRVQRIPVTEKHGKLQTSTCAINILPNASATDVLIKKNEIKVELKTSSGPGGQNVNKRETCVRIIHLPTGIVVESQEERYQEANKSIAMLKLRNILHKMELEKKNEKVQNLKKEQAASLDRSLKIRTYNFAQNRITDHRINCSVSSVDEYLEGNKSLDKMIEATHKHFELQLLINNINKILDRKNADELFSLNN